MTQRVFVFVDIAGFSALTEAHGDVEAARLIQRFARAMRRLSAPHGRLVKSMGDGALIVFDDARTAIRFADALISDVELMPERPGIKVGMNRGEAVEINGDYLGHAVNIAARVASQADSCQVLITAAVHGTLAGEEAFSWQSLGSRKLKNIAAPIELFLLVREACEFDLDPVCRMRLAANEGVSMMFRGQRYRFCSKTCVDTFMKNEDNALSRSL